MRLTTLAITVAAYIFCLGRVFAFETTLQLYAENFPPYNFVEDGQLKGMNYDIVANACRLANLRCEFHVLPWNRAYNMVLDNPNSGLLTISRYPKREALFEWVAPLVYGNACFYRLKSRDDVFVENEADLLNYTVGIARGDIYQSVLNGLGMEEGKHYITFSNKHEDARMFAQNKLDMMIGSSITLGFQLAQVGLTPDDVHPVMEIDDDSLGGNFFALNKHTDSRIVTALKETLKLMLQDQIYEQIIDKYQLSDSDNRTSKGLVRCFDGATNITTASN